jgi:hypothetical protein
LSFFDEGGEPPTSRVPRPRRPSTGAPSGRVDDQTLLVRRAVAAGGGLLLLILLIVGIKGCLDSRRESALKSYNRDVSALAGESTNQVSKPLFTLLTNAGGKDPLSVETTVNEYRVTAEQEVDHAKNLSVPSQMAAAQRDLLLAFDLRAEALKKIADNVRTALGSQGADAAVTTIAGEMEALLASDVIYAQRVVPLIQQTLADQHIGGQTIASSQFLPDLGWLAPQVVSSRLLGRGLAGNKGTAKPGTHGHGLLSVSVGSQTLSPGTTVNSVTLTTNLTFNVKVANQGSNDETGVVVSISLQGGGSPITATKTIDTKAGTVQDVSLALTQTPPVGTPLRLVANVAPVPGEKVLSNNTLKYLVKFTH